MSAKAWPEGAFMISTPWTRSGALTPMWAATCPPHEHPATSACPTPRMSRISSTTSA